MNYSIQVQWNTSNCCLSIMYLIRKSKVGIWKSWIWEKKLLNNSSTSGFPTASWKNTCWLIPSYMWWPPKFKPHSRPSPLSWSGSDARYLGKQENEKCWFPKKISFSRGPFSGSVLVFGVQIKTCRLTSFVWGCHVTSVIGWGFGWIWPAQWALDYISICRFLPSFIALHLGQINQSTWNNVKHCMVTCTGKNNQWSSSVGKCWFAKHGKTQPNAFHTQEHIKIKMVVIG